MMFRLLLLIGCLASVVCHGAEIALIIDDMGKTKKDAAAFELPHQVAFSILPLTPLSTQYSQRAAAQQREVMLHIPMESLAGKRLGPGGLTADMHPDAILTTLQQALKSVPHAIGMNNHMGSKLTQLTLPMSTTMDFLHQHNLFFVDSRTTRYSKAAQIAKEKGLVYAKRNVFLDHFAETRHIDTQFKRLLRIAKKHGKAIGIAHPYPETMAYLKKALPALEANQVQLVYLSDMLQLEQLAKDNAGSAASPVGVE